MEASQEGSHTQSGRHIDGETADYYDLLESPMQ